MAAQVSEWTPEQVSQITDACQIDVTDIEDIYLCTPLQEALTAVTARVPQSYISREHFRLSEDMNLERFRNAWELVVENSPILRTRICSIVTHRGVEYVQVVCRRGCEWVETALNLTDSNPGMVLGAPLARCCIERNLDEVLFKIVRHHSIYDGFSAKLVWDDFIYAYTNSARPPARPPYRRYVDFLSSIDPEEVHKFWAEDLHDHKGEYFPALPSPDYVPQVTFKSSQTAEARFKWNASCPYTFATVVRAAWAILQSTRVRASGADKDVCFIATLSGRSAPVADLEDINSRHFTS